MQVLDTPDTPTIDLLVECVKKLARGGAADGLSEIGAADTLKSVVVKVMYPGAPDSDATRGRLPEVLIVGVPGDREVDFKRLEAVVSPGEVEMFEAADFAKHPKLVKGYIGPVGLAEAGYKYLVDPRVAVGTSWVTGANEAGKHAAHVVAGRDFEIQGTIEAAEVRAGDLCPRCGHPLSIDRGIEIGHIFQLGRKYADVAKLDVLGKDGKPNRVTMGSYGVGVSRAVAVVAEQAHDELGLVWPREIAPADVHIVAASKNDQAIFEAADRFTEELGARGVRVLLDDRTSVSPGVKFKDAELIGIPTIVVVGKNLAEGVIEVRDRKSGERLDVPVADLVEHVRAVVEA
jgi:prolyl-tRNA synthetase